MEPRELLDVSHVCELMMRTGTANLPDLTAISVPVRRPLMVSLAFRAARPPLGERMAAYLDGEKICDLKYDGETSPARTVVDISDRLRPGQAMEFRVRCFVTADLFRGESDVGELMLLSDGNAVIDKRFTTRSPAEPWDHSWTIRLNQDD